MASGGPTEASYLRPRRSKLTVAHPTAGTVIDHLDRRGAALHTAPSLHPFSAARTNPGHERVGQALRFCLSDFVRMKGVPARGAARLRPRPWPAQYERRWASWVLVLARSACPLMGNPVGNLVHAMLTMAVAVEPPNVAVRPIFRSPGTTCRSIRRLRDFQNICSLMGGRASLPVAADRRRGARSGR